MRDWPWISDNALTLYCGVLFVENHTCMHVDETTGNCRSLTQSYKWGFFSLTQILTLVYLCHSEDLWLQCCMSLFSVMHPFLFFSLSTTLLDSNVLRVAYDRIILCVPHLHHFNSHTWTYEGIIQKKIVRDAEWTFSCIYMYHQFVYTHWFFLSFVKSDEI